MAKNNEEKTLKEMKEEFEAMKKAIQKKEQEELEKKRAEEALKKTELENQKEARKKEIKECEENLMALYLAFLKDFGYLEINHTTSLNKFFSPFFKHHLFFN